MGHLSVLRFFQRLLITGLVVYLVAGNQLSDPTKRVLTAVVVEQKPFVSLKAVGGNITKIEGFCVDLMDRLAKMLGYAYEWYQSPKNEFGHLDGGGNWTGMVGEVQCENADVTIGPLTISSKRLKVVDFTLPFMTTSVGLLLRGHTAEAHNGLLLLTPFTMEAWVCILAIYVGLSLLLRFITFIRRKYEVGDASVNSSWIDAHPDTQSIPARILATGYWLFSCIIVATYISNLSASFNMQTRESNISSLEDLSSNPNISFGLVQNQYIFDVFKRHGDAATGTVYDKLYQRIKTSGSSALMTSSTEGISKVKEGNFVFLEEFPVVKYAVLTDKDCALVASRSTFIKEGGFGIATRIGDPLGSELTRALKRLQENGEVGALIKKWWPETKCNLYGDSVSLIRDSPLTHDKLSGVFLILGGFALVALLVTIGQVILKVISKKWQ